MLLPPRSHHRVLWKWCVRYAYYTCYIDRSGERKHANKILHYTREAGTYRASELYHVYGVLNAKTFIETRYTCICVRALCFNVFYILSATLAFRTGRNIVCPCIAAVL